MSLGRTALAPPANGHRRSCAGMTPPAKTMVRWRPFSAPGPAAERGLCDRRRRRAADGMHVVLDRLAAASSGVWNRADVDIEAEVGVTGSHHLGAAVVTVLTERRS